MTLPDLNRLGILDEFAKVFGTGDHARALLDGIGFPLERASALPRTAKEFWETVCGDIEGGPLQGGLDPLLRAAAERYPGNKTFGRFAGVPGDARLEASLTIKDAPDVYQVVAEARRIARDKGLPGRVAPPFEWAGTVQVHLSDMNREQVELLASVLSRELGLEVSSAMSEFRDYLIGPIYVELQDGSRFELNNVPASTNMEQLARTITRNQEPYTCSLVRPLGRESQLPPDANLRSCEIRDGDTIRIAARVPDRRFEISVSGTYPQGLSLDPLNETLAGLSWATKTGINWGPGGLIRIILEGTDEDYRLVRASCENGDLQRRLGLPVIDVRLMPDESVYPHPSEPIIPGGRHRGLKIQKVPEPSSTTVAAAGRTNLHRPLDGPVEQANSSGGHEQEIVSWQIVLEGPDSVTVAALPEIVEFLKSRTSDRALRIVRAEWD